MVSRIYGRPPDAGTYQGKDYDHPAALPAHGSVCRGYKHIGGMERRYRGKDIGVLTIQGMEHGYARKGIETPQASHIARRVGAFWVMADDLLAGIYSLIVIIIIRCI